MFPPDTYVELMMHEEIATEICNVYCIHLGTASYALNNISTWESNGFGFHHFHRYFLFANFLNEHVAFFGQKF